MIHNKSRRTYAQKTAARGVIAALVCGLVFMGCGKDDDPTTPTNQLPAPTGTNELAGLKVSIYYEYTFNDAGTYTLIDTGDNNKDRETGTYSWNSESAPKTVSLKPETRRGQTADQYKKEMRDEYASLSADEKEEWDDQLEEAGYSNLETYLNADVSDRYAITTFDYDFFDTTKTLVFLQKQLPSNRTANNDLKDRNITSQDGNNAVYSFTDDNKYSRTAAGYSTAQEGTYLSATFMGTNFAYFKPTKVDNKTWLAYYGTPADNADTKKAKAKETNNAFETYSRRYKNTNPPTFVLNN